MFATARRTTGGSARFPTRSPRRSGSRPADNVRQVHWVEHHPAHLASTFFVSPFDEAAVCAIDGFGDFVSTSWAVGRGSRLDVLQRTFFPHSLGCCIWRSRSTSGSSKFGDEFKVMGLAPYGDARLRERDSPAGRGCGPDGDFELDLSYFQHWSGGAAMTWDDGEPTLGRVFSEQARGAAGPGATSRRAGHGASRSHRGVAAGRVRGSRVSTCSTALHARTSCRGCAWPAAAR